MKNIKKFFYLVLICILVIVLQGCFGSEKNIVLVDGTHYKNLVLSLSYSSSGSDQVKVVATIDVDSLCDGGYCEFEIVLVSDKVIVSTVVSSIYFEEANAHYNESYYLTLNFYNNGPITGYINNIIATKGFYGFA